MKITTYHINFVVLCDNMVIIGVTCKKQHAQPESKYINLKIEQNLKKSG